MWSSLVLVSLAQAGSATQCDAPRTHDTAALAAAIAQDKVMGQTFLKAAGACGVPGDACTAARTECAAILTSTAQKQVGFDEGIWLRDMLLPYQGAYYPMSRTFGAAQVANDGSCNVEVSVLNAAGQRRSAQAIRRDGLLQEYALYTKWAAGQQQQCRDKLALVAGQNEAARLEAERAAAATAAAAATVAAASAAKAAEEKKARDAADAAAAEAKRKEEADRLAKEEALRQEEQRRKDIEDAEKRRQDEKEAEEKKIAEEREAAEKKAREDEENKLVAARDTRVAQARAEKKKLVADAETQLEKARAEEAVKKQAAVDAVSSSPAIAAAAVAEAADAEKARIAAEKNLVNAKEKAAAIEIDDAYERGVASVFLNGGFGAVDGGSGMAGGALLGAHFGIWGTAPSEGMASGVEFRVWARYLAQINPALAPESDHTSIDVLLTGRYYFGHLALGLAGELRFMQPAFGTLRAGVGPTLAAAFIDNKDTRVVLAVNYVPIGNQMDPVRLIGDFEVGYKLLSIHVLGGSMTRQLADGTTQIGWQLGGYLGLRYSW